jgi:Tol biopolymer transport system component
MVHPELTLLDLSTRKELRVGVFDPSDPAWSPDGRSLVFASPRVGGRYDLWIQSLADGRPAGPPRRLTDHPGSVAHPAYSPDGRWIAYYRVVAGQRDVWTVPAAGGEPLRFTDSPAADVHPAWSPDGKQLAFASERDGRLRIWAAPVEEGRPAGSARRLTSGPTKTDMLPTWSPDGRWVAYIGDAANESSDSDVWIADVSRPANPPRALATEGKAQYAVWAADSRALFVSGQWDARVSLRKYALDTGRRIPLDPPIQFGQDGAVSSFDVSRVGHVVAFAKHELRGDIWALESLDRPY